MGILFKSLNSFYHKIESEIIYSIALSPGTGQSFSIGRPSVGFISVEKLFQNVTGIIKDKEWLNFLSTLRVKINANEYGVFMGGVTQKEDISIIIENFKRAFIEVCLPAFERYSNPQNVLELWDSLDDKGRSEYFQDPYNYVKIIILSKISGDLNYKNRCHEAIQFYTKHYNNGIESAKVLIEDCEKVVKYLSENEV